MEKKINLKKFYLFFQSKKNLETKTITYSLNLFIPTLIMLIFSFFQKYDLVAEMSILIGANIIFTQIFSANARALIIKNKDEFLIKNSIKFRLYISFFLLILNLIILKFLNTSYYTDLILIAVIILTQWIIEINLTSLEINKNISKFKIYNSISIFIIIFVCISLLLKLDITYSLVLYCLFLFYFIVNDLRNKKINFFEIKNLKNLYNKIIFSSEFISSFSISLANLIWRIAIIFFCGKVLAGIYFAGYAIGSLPGSIFNNTFGPTVIREKIKIRDIWFKFFKLFLIIIFLLTLIFFFKYKIFEEYLFTQIFCSMISLLGSYFMISGLVKRQKLIQHSSNKKIFIVDIFYSIFVLSLTPILYNIGGAKILLFSFLVLSIISYLTYNLAFLVIKK